LSLAPRLSSLAESIGRAFRRDESHGLSDWEEAIQGVVLEMAEGNVQLRYLGVVAIIAEWRSAPSAA
jgi:hypothetical protein